MINRYRPLTKIGGLTLGNPGTQIREVLENAPYSQKPYFKFRELHRGSRYKGPQTLGNPGAQMCKIRKVSPILKKPYFKKPYFVSGLYRGV